jgi:ABC-type branched-subunit amino acid transport system substrate-binding protein
VTSNSINVAGLVSKTIFGASLQGAQARFDRENSNGGVFGRKIKMVDVADDKFDPTTNVQETRRVVSAGNVFAMVPTVTVTLGSGDYLAQQKVPFFGWGISAGFCGNQYGYGFTGCVTPKTPVYGNSFMPAAGAKALNKDPKGLTVAIIAEDTDAARSGLGTLGTAAQSLGIKVVYSKGVVPAPPATVGDFTPFSQAIMTSNAGGPPDFVIILFASIPSTLGLQGTLQAAGFKGPIENTQTYDPQLAAPSKGGSVYVQFGAFETADTVPGVKQMVADLNKANAPLGVLSAVGYLSADMFIAALKKTGKNLTVDAFQKAAGSLQYNVKNTAGPTSFPKDRVQPGVCGTLVTSNGTGYDVTVPYFCGKAVKQGS